jgi:hypothetical protein
MFASWPDLLQETLSSLGGQNLRRVWGFQKDFMRMDITVLDNYRQAAYYAWLYAISSLL